MKKWLVALVLILGGVIMFFSLNNVSQREALDKKIQADQQHQLETSLAKLLVSEYEGIEKIEFTGWGHSIETGIWGTTVIINGNNRMSFSFDALSGLEEISGSSYHPDTFKLQEKPNLDELEPVIYRVKEIEQIALDGIEIIYSDKTRG